MITFSFSVGKPIEVEKIEKPTHEDIEHLHQTFIEEITHLFETQKHNYLKGSEQITLEII